MAQRKDRLTELLPTEQQAELGDLGPVTARLEGYVAPTPTPAETARLIAALRPLVAGRAEAFGATLPDEPAAAHGLHLWVRLALTQSSLLEPPFWWASAGLFLLGVLVGAAGRGSVLALGFVLAAPVLAAAGVAYAFRPAAQAIRELELASPIQPIELVYARLGLVLAFNLVLSLGVLGVIWFQAPQLVLWRLVLLWLGPMLGLAGVALYAAVRWGALAGGAAPLVLWVSFCYSTERWMSDGSPVPWRVDTLLSAISKSNGLMVAALVGLAGGVVLLRQAGRLAVGESVRWN